METLGEYEKTVRCDDVHTRLIFAIARACLKCPVRLCMPGEDCGAVTNLKELKEEVAQ